MRQHSWSLQDAKNRFSEVVQAAQRQAQTVTKHGKPAVVVLSMEEYQRLKQQERLNAPSFIDMLLAIPTGDIDVERIKVVPRDIEF